MIYGYARVSTKEQKIDRQIKELEKAKCEKIYIEKQSGKDFNREVYQALKKKLKSGDKLVVASLDRLGRNYEQIVQEWKWLNDNGCYIQVLDMEILDTSKQYIGGLDGRFISDLVLQILAYVSQKEREKIKERQMQGIKVAQEKGVQFGRPRKPLPDNADEIFDLYEGGGITYMAAREMLNVSRATFFRLLKERRNNK